MHDPKLEILDVPSYENMMRFVIDYADGVVIEEKLDSDTLADYARRSGKPVLEWNENCESAQYMDAYHNFYDEVLGR